ncbi:MAG: DUF368 domain-containing protein [Porticoccaceae bacterium]
MAVNCNYPLLFIKGIAMGAADVVPGVSGGTIAFISGIYDELIDSLKAINPGALKVLCREGVTPFWRAINGNFLVVLFAGIFTSILSLAQLVRYLLEHQPLLIWSFFFGLIVASIIYVVRQQRCWRFVQILGLMSGTGLALAAAFSPPMAVHISPLTVFFSGMLAICAMILPGISGSFILLLLGVYPVMIEAVAEANVVLLSSFIAGAVIGLVAFSHILSWLLHHHRATTLSVLIGFLVGSLPVVWPWKIELSLAGAGASRQLLLPGDYGSAVGSPRMLECLGLMAVGLVLVLALELAGDHVARQRKRLL